MKPETKYARSGDVEDRPEKATYPPGDYGRIIRQDGTEQWWVRSSSGKWIALRHQRVMPNDDGGITLLLRADQVID